VPDSVARSFEFFTHEAGYGLGSEFAGQRADSYFR
jgi:hypothetical protein